MARKCKCYGDHRHCKSVPSQPPVPCIDACDVSWSHRLVHNALFIVVASFKCVRIHQHCEAVSSFIKQPFVVGSQI